MTVAFPNAGPVKLRTNLAEYPVTRALRSGAIESDLVSFDFIGPKQAYQGFKPLVRELSNNSTTEARSISMVEGTILKNSSCCHCDCNSASCGSVQPGTCSAGQVASKASPVIVTRII